MWKYAATLFESNKIAVRLEGQYLLIVDFGSYAAKKC